MHFDTITATSFSSQTTLKNEYFKNLKLLMAVISFTLNWEATQRLWDTSIIEYVVIYKLGIVYR